MLHHVAVISESQAIISLHSDDAPEAFPFQHQIKGLVDFSKWDFMSNKLLQFEFLKNEALVLSGLYQEIFS